MKWMIWTICGVLAALWTGVAAVAALAVGWMGGALQRAGATGVALPLPAELPAWLTGWLEPASWSLVLHNIVEALGALQGLLPTVGAATGWFEPLMWVLWGLGMIALLVVATGLHWLLGGKNMLPSRSV
jgi:hypothetical protein